MHQRKTFTVALASVLAAALLAACAPQESGDTAGAGETFAGLPRVTPESAGMSSERLDRIRPAFESYVTDGKLSGVITVVARDGQVVHFEASGYQDVEAGEPMTEDTLFRMYSMTKPIASAALMMLWEEGHFLLSTPLAAILPEFADTQVYVLWRRRRHGDGAAAAADRRSRPDDPHVRTDLHLHPQPRRRQLRGRGTRGLRGRRSPRRPGALRPGTGRSSPLLAHPGTAWNYSVGLEVAGRVVEVASGQTFGEFLKERIFDPLGTGRPRPSTFQTGSSTGSPSTTRRRRRVASSVMDDPETSAYRKPPKVEMGGSGLVATAGDYLRFAQMLANGGELDGVRILGTQTVALMMDNHLGSAYGPSPMSSLNLDMGMSEGMGYGLGGYSITDTGLTGLPASPGTYGWGGAASTDFLVDPEEELVAIVLTQLLPHRHLSAAPDDGGADLPGDRGLDARR